MNEFKLVKMSIHNFKAIDSLDVDFSQKETIIRGANGSGKTSVFDAFTWCLFGKDHEDRTDKGRGSFAVKKMVDGVPVANMDHEVMLTISLNGHTMTLGRRLSETWRTRGGEQVFDGDKTTCMWDGIEIGVNEYNKRIEEEFIGAAQFKMLTNPMYFSSLPWKDQLSFLTSAFAKEVTIESVAAEREEWQHEISHLSPKVTIGDVKTQISTEKKRLGDRLKEIPNIIKGIREATPAGDDWEAIEAQRKSYEEEIAGLDAAMRSTADGERAKYDEAQKLQQEINAKRNAILAKVKEENDKLRATEQASVNRYLEAKDQLTKTEDAKDEKIKERARMKDAANRAEAEHDRKMAGLKSEIERLLAEWEKVEHEEFKQSDVLVCPLCKEPCDSAKMIAKHASDREAMRKCFNADKAKRLDEIDAQGGKCSEQMTAEEERWAKACEELKAALDKNYQEYVTIDDTLKKQKEAFYGMKIDSPVRLAVKDITECVEMEKAVVELEEKIKAMQGKPADVTELMSKKAELKKAVSELDAKLGIRSLIDANGAKVEALKDEEQSLARQKDDLERRIDNIEQLQRAFVDAVEATINSRFEHVVWRTKDTQVNGETAENCYATLGGVRFADLNDAGKIYAGLDIISTLNRVYDMQAPIFIDRAESVTTQSYPYEGQIVKLVADYCDLTVEQH